MLKPFGGVPSVKQLEIVKSTTIEISAILNDPTMNFPIRHAKKPVYSQVNYLSDSIYVDDNDKFCPPTYIDKIDIKDHSFDRRDKKTAKKTSNYFSLVGTSKRCSKYKKIIQNK